MKKLCFIMSVVLIFFIGITNTLQAADNSAIILLRGVVKPKINVSIESCSSRNSTSLNVENPESSSIFLKKQSNITSGYHIFLESRNPEFENSFPEIEYPIMNQIENSDPSYSIFVNNVFYSISSPHPIKFHYTDFLNEIELGIPSAQKGAYQYAQHRTLVLNVVAN